MASIYMSHESLGIYYLQIPAEQNLAEQPSLGKTVRDCLSVCSTHGRGYVRDREFKYRGKKSEKMKVGLDARRPGAF